MENYLQEEAEIENGRTTTQRRSSTMENDSQEKARQEKNRRTKRNDDNDENETTWRNSNLRFRRAPSPSAKPEPLRHDEDGSGSGYGNGYEDKYQQHPSRPPIPLMVEKITGRISGVAMFVNNLMDISKNKTTPNSTVNLIYFYKLRFCFVKLSLAVLFRSMYARILTNKKQPSKK